MRSGVGIVFVLAFAVAEGPMAFGQSLTDLVGRKKEDLRGAASYDVQVRSGRNRVDLALSPNVRIPEAGDRKALELGGRADLRMICGQYDLKATYQHLLGKEAREEFLDGLLNMLVGELIGSGMDLLCQAEPTLCNLLQNYSVSANLKVGYYNDLCQAIEQAVVDAQKKSYAGAVDACLKEKQAQGYSLDRALEACKKRGGQVTGFDGQLIAELDLGKALRQVLAGTKMSPAGEDLVDRLSESTVVGGGSMTSKPDPNAVATFFEEIREGFRNRLDRLFQKGALREEILPEDLAKAAPRDAIVLTEDEVRTIGLLPVDERRDVTASLASAFALLELRRVIHEVERALEAVRSAPTVDEAKRNMLEERLDRLRSERRRFEELYSDQTLVTEALVRAKALGAREYAARIAERKAHSDLEVKKAALRNDVRPWGACPTGNSVSTAWQNAKPAGSPPGVSGSFDLQYGFGPGGPR